MPARITLDPGDGTPAVTRVVDAFQVDPVTGKVSIALTRSDDGPHIPNARVLADIWRDPALFLTVGTNRRPA